MGAGTGLSTCSDLGRSRNLSSSTLAYNWRDCTPRVVPIGFHWNGEEIVLATATDARKTKVLTNGSKVAMSIDRDFSASKVLAFLELSFT